MNLGMDHYIVEVVGVGGLGSFFLQEFFLWLKALHAVNFFH